MKRTNLLIFALVILLIALGLAIYYQNKPVQEETIQTLEPTPPPEPVKNPIVHYPVPEPVAEPAQPAATEEAPEPPAEPVLPEQLPAVQESDQSIGEALASLLQGKDFSDLLFLENFIQRFVATVDNLTEKRLPRAHLPVKPPAGKFIVAGTDDAPQTSSRNQQRYASYVTLLESLDQDAVIKVYSYFYPLFQTAYEQLGYQNAYFNDRLVFVIDHLLETPNPNDPLLLAQPSVLYIYADPALETLSSGQKVLLRIGQEQRSKVLEILEDYRRKLTSLHPK